MMSASAKRGWRTAISRSSTSRGSALRNIGRCSRPATRRSRVGSGTRSQTERAPEPAHRGARARIGEGAAAGRQHQRRPGQQAGDHPALAVAEMRLAVAGEDLRDRQAGGGLDLGIRIGERQAEPRGEPAADGRLPGAGHADENHGPRACRRDGPRALWRRRRNVRGEARQVGRGLGLRREGMVA
jgi:hypothetical protein